MCSERLPKEFEKTTEVLPFSKHGLTSVTEFQKAESELQQLEKFKRAGLSDVEIKLYEQYEAGTIEQKKMESTVLKQKIDVIHNKIRKLQEETEDTKEEASTSDDILKPLETYPEGHPMNSIKQIESNLFSHLKTDDIPSLSKRRKILRRFERKKERIISQDHFKPYPEKKRKIDLPSSKWDMQELNKDTLIRTGTKWDVQENQISNLNMKETNQKDRLISPRPGSKWDMQEIPDRDKNRAKTQSATEKETQPRPIPQNRLPIYTIKDNKIVRLEPDDKIKKVEPQDKIVRLDPPDKIVRLDPQDKIVRLDPQDYVERVDSQDNVDRADPQDNIVRLDPQDKIVEVDPPNKIVTVEVIDKMIRLDPQNKVERVEPQDKIVAVDSQELEPQDKIARLDPQHMEPPENVADRVQQDDAEQLLEGTKITVDDIKKIDEHKEYEPGIPSKVLILKNISPSVREDQLKLLFNQFILGNGGPVQVHMLEDRGCAYVYFTNEDTAIQALEEANGTVVAGRPIVAYFNATSRHR